MVRAVVPTFVVVLPAQFGLTATLLTVRRLVPVIAADALEAKGGGAIACGAGRAYRVGTIA